MLLHPFPKVRHVMRRFTEIARLIGVKIRITAAETLWVLTKEDGLKRQDWSLPSKILKPIVDELKGTIVAVIQQ